MRKSRTLEALIISCLACGGNTNQQALLQPEEPNPPIIIPTPNEPKPLEESELTIRIYGQNEREEFNPNDFPLPNVNIRINNTTQQTNQEGSSYFLLEKGREYNITISELPPLRYTTRPLQITPHQNLETLSIPAQITSGSILLFGDSNYTRNTEHPEQDFDSPLDEYLDGRSTLPQINIPTYIGTTIEVDNYSRGNTDSNEGINITEEALRNYAIDESILGIIGYGIIDSHKFRSAEEYTQNIETIARLLENKNILPVIITLAYEENTQYHTTINAYNNSLKELSARNKYILVTMDDITAEEHPELFYPHAIDRAGRDHFNRRGHELLGRRITEAFINHTTTGTSL